MKLFTRHRRSVVFFGFIAACWAMIAASQTGCGVSKPVAIPPMVRDSTTPPPTPHPPFTVAPNVARIRCTVMRADTSFQIPFHPPDTPAPPYPYAMVIRVDSITGYGSSFTSPLNIGQEISVRFSGPASSSSILEPSMPSQMSTTQGISSNHLESGASIYADVEQLNMPTGITYNVMNYSVAH